MFEEILKSKDLLKILEHFYTHQHRSFSLNELALVLKDKERKISQHLNKLSELGYLKNFLKKKKKYFILSAKAELHSEFLNRHKKLSKPKKDLLFSGIKKMGNVKAAFLSGIFTGHPHLGVDILVVGKIDIGKLSKYLKKVERAFGQDINFAIMTEDEFSFRRNTFDKFIKDIFDHNHLILLDNCKR